MLTRRTPRHRPAPCVGTDAGVTLIEVMVGMVLAMIVGALTLSFFVTMDRASNDTVDSNVTTASARNVIEAWTRLLSLADSPQTAGDSAGRFEQITPTSVVFYANMNNRSTTSGVRTPPTKVSLSLENGDLIERDYAPQSQVVPSTYPSVPTRTMHVASNIVTATGWLFAPYRAGDPPTLVEPTYCNSDTAPGLCAGDAAADAILPTINRIDIEFSVQASDGSTQNYQSSAVITGSQT